MRRLLLWWLGALFSLPLWAAGSQNLATLEKLADTFLKHELSLRAATWKLGSLDRRLVLPDCPKPKADWAVPGVTTGSTFIAVSCPEMGWSLRIPVLVNEKRLGVALTRPISAGEIVGESDVRLADVPNPALASNVLSDVRQAIGQVMRSGAPAGAWLRNFMVRAPYLVRINQLVKVVASGDGFDAVADGTALGNATAGEQVTVRMGSGRVIRGIVQADGSVSVVY